MAEQIQIYANKVLFEETPTEIVLDFHFTMKESGKHTLLQRVIVPKSVAAQMGIALYPDDQKEESSDGTFDSDNRPDNNRASKPS